MDELGNKIYRMLDDHAKRYKAVEHPVDEQQVQFLLGATQEIQLIARDIKHMYRDFFYKQRLQEIQLRLDNRRELLTSEYKHYWEFAKEESVTKYYAKGHMVAVTEFAKAFRKGCLEGIYEPYET